MTDCWDDDDYEVPVINSPTKEQLKRLEERKLVEEADNALAIDLFQNEEDKEELNQYSKIKLSVKKDKPEKKLNKQKENEEKQKEQSKRLKEEKAKREKEQELFGEIQSYDKYADYEDKFY